MECPLSEAPLLLPESVEAILMKQLHVFLHKTPERVKLAVCVWHPWWALHHHIDTVEVPLSLETVPQVVSGAVHKETARTRVLGRTLMII